MTTNQCPNCTVDMEVVERNSATCNECGDEIESKHRHDFQSCSCGNICVDGGLDYRRRLCKNGTDWTDTSIYHTEPFTFSECLHNDPLDGIIRASAGLYEHADEDPNCDCTSRYHEPDCELS